MQRPVRILGAGVAGLSAAIYLAKYGFNVEVYEKKLRIGSKFGRHINALRLYAETDCLQCMKELGEIKPFAKIKRMVKQSPRFRRVVEGELYELYERGASYDSLEMQLYRIAHELGVRIFLGQRIPEEEADILATGTPLNQYNILAVGYFFPFPRGDRKLDEVILLYNHTIAPAGYFCIMPARDGLMYLSVSFTVLSSKELFRRVDYALKHNPYLRQMVAGFRPLRRVAGRGYYSRDPIEQATKNGRLIIGEAAGFQDARRGFGIRYALLSAKMAAQSIAEGRPFEKLLRDYFGDEFERLYEIRKHIQVVSSNDFFDRLVSHLEHGAGIDEYLQWKQFEQSLDIPLKR